MANVIVLFEVTVKEGKMEDYLAQAGALKADLKRAEGFIRSERFSSLATEGKILSMPVRDSEESVAKWRNLEAHRNSRRHGRREDFADYTITVVTPVRTYTMLERTEAPEDSDQALLR